MPTQPLKVLFIASEADPFVKIGGLGDVAGTLPQNIRDLHPLDQGGVDIRLAIPFHHVIDRDKHEIKPIVSFDIPGPFGSIPTTVYQSKSGDLPVYLFDSPILPQDGPVYHTEVSIDAPVFTHFSLSVLQFLREIDWQIDLLHAHDWHTALAVYVLAQRRDTDPFFVDTKTLLTIHNLPYHGALAMALLDASGIELNDVYRLPWWSQDRPFPLGLLTADHINAVSPGYAGEILTEEFGAGLSEFLQTRKIDISGIINGIDTITWDPQTDAHLSANFDINHLEERKKNKTALLEQVGLTPDPDTFLIGMINRMDNQKGVDLVPPALRQLDDLPWQAVILGTGDPQIESEAKQLETDFPDRIRTILRYDGSLARRIYAGTDTLLIPSRYEPCGLTQMIAMRYGNVPIARATGGLKDTIVDYHEGKDATGFLFKEAQPDALAGTISRAMEVFIDRKKWIGLQRRGMKQDFSLAQSAEKYLHLYQKIVNEDTGVTA